MEREIDKLRVDRTVLSVVSLDDTSDRDYWHSRTPEERLEAAELMRQIVYGYDPATERMQKTIIEIVQRDATMSSVPKA